MRIYKSDSISVSEERNRLLNIGYTELENRNGGDDDYILIDEDNKKFIMCEFGEGPGEIGNEIYFRDKKVTSIYNNCF